jgi:hypothetical protein
MFTFKIINNFILSISALLYYLPTSSANSAGKIPDEHLYATVYMKVSMFKGKNIIENIATSPNTYADHMRLFAAYHYAGLFVDTGLQGNDQCNTSLMILNKTLTSNLEGAAKLIRFYCLSKADKSDVALKELKQASNLKEIPFGQNHFADDALRCLKDLNRVTYKDYMSVHIIYEIVPMVNFSEIVKTLPALIEKKLITAKEYVNLGRAIELGAKKDFTNSNQSTLIQRGTGIKIQRQALTYCTDGLIACKDLEIAVRTRFEALKVEETENEEKRGKSIFYQLMLKAEKSGDPVNWLTKGNDVQKNEFIKSIEKDDLWLAYLKLK